MTTTADALSKVQRGIVEYLGSLAPGERATALGMQLELIGSTEVTARAIRREIKRLNDMGVPVVSDTNGFYLARTDDEIATYRDALIQRANKILERVQALEWSVVA